MPILDEILPNLLVLDDDVEEAAASGDLERRRFVVVLLLEGDERPDKAFDLPPVEPWTRVRVFKVQAPKGLLHPFVVLPTHIQHIIIP